MKIIDKVVHKRTATIQFTAQEVRELFIKAAERALRMEKNHDLPVTAVIQLEPQAGPLLSETTDWAATVNIEIEIGGACNEVAS